VAASDRQALGHRKEKQALHYLRQQGLRLVESNFRTRFGEIDLVMREGDCLIFVEVRYRRQRGYATAAESVDSHKRRKLALAAEVFARARPRWANCTMRFAVVAFDRPAGQETTLTWIRDAFRPDG